MRRIWPALLVAGCTQSPSQNILGSYFPSWLICVAGGVVATAVLRQVLVLTKLEAHLLLPPLVYIAMAAGASMAIWLIWFGQ